MFRGKVKGDILLQPYFHITVDHKDLQPDMEKYIEEVSVSMEEDKLTSAVITVNDYDKKWRNAKGFTGGKALNIRMGYKHDNKVLLWGKITHIEADFSEDGHNLMTFYAVSRGVDMMKHRYSKVFKNAKVSEVIRYLHTNAGIQCEVADTKTVFDTIVLSKETASEFIHRWRNTLGWNYFQKEDKSFYFGPKGKKEVPSSVLGYRTGNHVIRNFRPFYRDIETEEDEDETQLDSQSTANNPSKKTSRHKPFKKPGKTNVRRVSAKKK